MNRPTCPIALIIACLMAMVTFAAGEAPAAQPAPGAPEVTEPATAEEPAPEEPPEAEKPALVEADLPEPPKSAFKDVIQSVLPQMVRVERGEKEQLGGSNRVGAGIVLTADGFILTNAILAGDGLNLNVITHGGKVHPAILVKRDRRKDVCVIKIQAEGLTPAVLGDSAEVEPRQWVLVAGNPFGVAKNRKEPISVNKGVISSVMPIEAVGYRYEGPVILTDAAINAGSAGGAVINLEGKVVGVASRTVKAKSTNTEVNAAMPINAVKPLITQSLDMYETMVRDNPDLFQELLPEAKPEEKGYFGAAILDDDTADVGAYVQKVIPISPAFQGGLRSEDLIVAADGKNIPHGRAMLEYLETVKVGQEIELTVNRGGERKRFTVTLGEQPKAVVQ